MPYVKFDSPTGKADNRGSCDAFVSYLAKEDFREEELTKEFFFNHRSDLIPDYEVVQAIDGNRQGLGSSDAKFYTGSISFSEDEQLFLGNHPESIKAYTVEVMRVYAEQFNKGLTVDDLSWFAKVERNRYYKGDDPEVVAGERRQGEPKEGLQTHVHFIVGRKSADGRRKLSPKTNHSNTKVGPVQGGFDRNGFKLRSEEAFDRMFEYLRPAEESYLYLRAKAKGTVDEREKAYRQHALDSTRKQSYTQETQQGKERRIRQLANYICHGVDKQRVKQLDVERLIGAEREAGYSGHVYRSLVNLNRSIKNGKSPDGYNLTDTVLNYADHLRFKATLAEEVEKGIPVGQILRETFATTREEVFTPASLNPEHYEGRGEDDPVERQRKRKRRKRDADDRGHQQRI
ncbi:MAG: DUF5712 family protein [Tenuifilaceae bacterium]|jgi:hypothetical protein|nr:DUF5712 family protein [Tenuifilaceae bacterium]